MAVAVMAQQTGRTTSPLRGLYIYAVYLNLRESSAQGSEETCGECCDAGGQQWGARVYL